MWGSAMNIIFLILLADAIYGHRPLIRTCDELAYLPFRHEPPPVLVALSPARADEIHAQINAEREARNSVRILTEDFIDTYVTNRPLPKAEMPSQSYQENYQKFQSEQRRRNQ